MQDMHGRTAVITGAAHGIGFAMAEEFLDRGARVCLVDLKQEALDEAAALLGADDGRVITVAADVGDPDAVHRLRSRVHEAFGHVDVVCANAGVGARRRPVWETPVEEWRWVFDVNVFGVVQTVQAFAGDMIARDEGHIVVTSSMQGITTGRQGPYASSKHASAAIAESLRNDLVTAGSGVGVSCLCPSHTRTSIAAAGTRLRYPGAEETAADIAGVEEIARRLAEDGQDPRLLARMVADAVGTETFWIIPDPASLWRVTQRATEIVEGRTPSQGSVERERASS